MFKSFLFLLICSIAIIGTNAVYFSFFNIMEKCLIEDFRHQDNIVAHYVNRNADISKFVIRVIDPNGKELMNQRLTDKGQFTFTSKQDGIHKVCFMPEHGPWIDKRSQVRFEIRISNGEHNYEDLAKKEHLSNLQVMIMKIKDHCDDFIKMQEQNREDESTQVEQNQNVNERVIYTTLFQTVVILVSGVYQIYSLRKYFIQKKLL